MIFFTSAVNFLHLENLGQLWKVFPVKIASMELFCEVTQILSLCWHSQKMLAFLRGMKSQVSLCSLFKTKVVFLILQETSNHVYMVMEVKTNIDDLQNRKHCVFSKKSFTPIALHFDLNWKLRSTTLCIKDRQFYYSRSCNFVVACTLQIFA